MGVLASFRVFSSVTSVKFGSQQCLAHKSLHVEHDLPQGLLGSGLGKATRVFAARFIATQKHEDVRWQTLHHMTVADFPNTFK